jgi:membrane-associated phospholipid phosphatase/tRNA A-37 threonylcarbamoyl transferase component Bud32
MSGPLCSALFAQVTLAAEPHRVAIARLDPGSLLVEPTLRPASLADAEPVPNRPTRISRSGRRRRPSGEAPPLPRALITGRYWLAATGLVLLLWLAAFASRATNNYILAFDLSLLDWVSRLRTDALTDVMQALHALGSRWTIRVLFWSTVLVLVVFRRFRHLFVFVGAVVGVIVLSSLLAYLFMRPRPLGVEILGHWTGAALPSRPVAVFTAMLVGMLYGLVPQGRLRQVAKLVVGALVAALSVSLVYLAVHSPTDVLFGAIIGVTVPLVAFRMLAPNEVFPVSYQRGQTAHLDVGGRRGQAIHRALEDQLGVQVLELKPFGLSGSAGSTPLRVCVKGDPNSYLFAKLYAGSHLRADRWYKLGRTLLYGRLEDEKPFNTVRRLVQQEDYALRVMHGAGVRSPEPFGVVEITPEREYLVVTEFFGNAKEIGELEQVDEAMIDDGLRIIRRLWDAGLAHRDIKPANLLVREGRVHLIDVFFAEVRPSPWRQAVDLANMMLVLATRSSPQQVYERARLQFNDDEIAEAFAATRGFTMPSQLRRWMREQGRDLHAEFLHLLPERPEPISTQRWSLRRVGLLAAVLVGGLLVLLVVVDNLRAAGLL